VDLGSLSRDRGIHLSGIGGSAMSGLARILRQRGFPVSGTDPRPDPALEVLAALGIAVHDVQDGSRIPPDTQLLVATAALPAGHPELVAARVRGIPVVKYARVLAALMAERDGVAVAGTHGKSTTTAMIVASLRAAGTDPGFLLGGSVPAFGTGAGAGTSPVFVAEACEYDRSFLALRPRRAVILNVEAEHLDVYGDLDGVRSAFAAFAANLPADGALFYCADDPALAPLLERSPARRISFGLADGAEVRARDVRREPAGSRFQVMSGGEPVGEVRLGVPGLHNVTNALAALAVGLDRGLPFAALAEGLAAFGGVARRFELRGEAGGVTVVDDYAHHPTEIRALLAAARQRYPGRRLVVVFQPHQVARTRALLDDFARVLAAGAGRVVLTDIYAVRGEAGEDTDSGDLARRIAGLGGEADHVPRLEDVPGALRAVLRAGDVLLTVGAGHVHVVAAAVLAERGE
jgi:UDP-N-acetylmuramate--alanine ligase